VNHSIRLRKAQVKDIVKATFPEYKGRTFRVEFTARVSFYDTNWGGGTRNSYAAIKSDGRTARLSVSAPWLNVVEGKVVDLPADVLIVKHTILCGKDLGITIYANPVHLPKWLTA